MIVTKALWGMCDYLQLKKSKTLRGYVLVQWNMGNENSLGQWEWQMCRIRILIFLKPIIRQLCHCSPWVFPAIEWETWWLAQGVTIRTEWGHGEEIQHFTWSETDTRVTGQQSLSQISWLQSHRDLFRPARAHPGFLSGWTKSLLGFFHNVGIPKRILWPAQ